MVSFYTDQMHEPYTDNNARSSEYDYCLIAIRGQEL